MSDTSSVEDMEVNSSHNNITTVDSASNDGTETYSIESDNSDWEISSVSSEELENAMTCNDEDQPDKGWTDTLYPVEVEPFTEDVGPKHELPTGSNPTHFFNLLFEDEFFQTIAEQTNLYAEQIQKTNGRDLKWAVTTIDEIRAFFSLYILMGVHKLSDHTHYWAQDRNLNVPGISECMALDRYEKLNQYLHLADDEQQSATNSPDYNPLYKVQPILDMLNKNFLKYYTPARELCIDEVYVRYKGYQPMKRYSQGKYESSKHVKVWQLCESSTGYTSQMKVSARKVNSRQSQVLGHMVVMDLMQPVLGRNYHVYLTDDFSTISLLNDLAMHQTYGCGAIRLSRPGIPPLVRNADLKRNGNSLKQQRGNLLFTVWKDVREQITLISTNQVPSDSMYYPKNGSPVSKPDAVTNFYKFMGGADVAEKLRTPFVAERRCSRAWWKAILDYCLDVAIVNAFLLHVSSNQPYPQENTKRSSMQLNFRLQLAEGLRGGFSSRKKTGGGRLKAMPLLRLQNVLTHTQVRVEGGKRICVQCSKDGRRSEISNRPFATLWKCLECNVPLCIKNGHTKHRDCFEKYHTANLAK